MSARTEPSPSRRLAQDLIAGTTVALVGTPQCVAYALIAGLPPAYGLVSAAVPGLLTAIAGKSAHIITGPTNTTGLLVLAALTPFLGPNGLIEASGLTIVATLTLLTGLIRLALVAAQGQALVRFISESVLAGFLTGAGILIGALQLDEALGLPPIKLSGPALLSELHQLFGLLAEGHAPSTLASATSLLTCGAIILGKKHAPKIPVTLLAVVLTTFLAWALGWHQDMGIALLHDKVNLPLGWPQIALPSTTPSLWIDLAPSALAIAVLGTLELAVTSRAGEDPVEIRREIASQGIANTLGALVGAYPSSVSLSRSALAVFSGAQSRWTPLVAALWLFPVLFFAAPTLGYIPVATLAGVLLATAWNMIRRKHIVRILRSNAQSRGLFLLTLLATLSLPLPWAVLLGVGTSIFLYLRDTSHPRLRLLTPNGQTLAPLPEHTSPKRVVLEVSGELHFAAVPVFQEDFHKIIPPETSEVIVDLSHAHRIRFAALLMFEELQQTLRQRGGGLFLAGTSPAFCSILQQTGSEVPYNPSSAIPGESALQAWEEMSQQNQTKENKKTPSSS